MVNPSTVAGVLETGVPLGSGGARRFCRANSFLARAPGPSRANDFEGGLMNLETRADFLLWRKGWPKDVLTEAQLETRHAREVYPTCGFPDGFISGLYRRAYNPDLDKRPSNRRRYALVVDPWRQDVWESSGR